MEGRGPGDRARAAIRQADLWTPNLNGWNRSSMSDPRLVYQLALRVGAGYEATCVALASHGIVDGAIAGQLSNTPPRDITSPCMANNCAKKTRTEMPITLKPFTM